MTGEAIRRVRVALGMEPAHFAQLLGVHPSTLYRWESAQGAEVRIEPMQLQLIAVLEQQINTKAAQARAELGQGILTGLLLGGAMLGLHTLLTEAYGKQRKRTSRKKS